MAWHLMRKPPREVTYAQHRCAGYRALHSVQTPTDAGHGVPAQVPAYVKPAAAGLVL